MAKAKKATAPEATATPADLGKKLEEMLGAKAKATASDVNAEVPMKKAAGGKSTWKGTMSIPNPAGGVLSVFGVKTYKATDEETFERHMYHSADCLNSLKYGAMTCQGCGAEVSKSAAVKGTEVDGKIVLISDDELSKMVAQNEKSMKITEYVSADDVNAVYIESTDFVAADKGGEMAFAMLVETLKRNNLVAKGHRVSKGKVQEFILRPYGQQGLTMHYLFADHEVRDANSLWLPVQVNPEMIELFSQIAEGMTKPFSPAKQDTYVKNCKALAKSKAAGTAPECPTPEAEQKQSTDDLLAQLKATLAATAKK